MTSWILGAERDDDGSVIAARSVSRGGSVAGPLGGRSVPAKSLSTFTTESLALHGSERPASVDATR
jgi:DNA repair protein RecN (Recombination protein N)